MHSPSESGLLWNSVNYNAQKLFVLPFLNCTLLYVWLRQPEAAICSNNQPDSTYAWAFQLLFWLGLNVNTLTATTKTSLASCRSCFIISAFSWDVRAGICRARQDIFCKLSAVVMTKTNQWFSTHRAEHRLWSTPSWKTIVQSQVALPWALVPQISTEHLTTNALQKRAEERSTAKEDCATLVRSCSVKNGDCVVDSLWMGLVRRVEEAAFASHADHKVLALMVEAEFPRAQHCL